MEDDLIVKVLERYRNEKRDLRASEPRDLIERARDICRLRHRTFTLDSAIITMAWNAYFGLTGR